MRPASIVWFDRVYLGSLVIALLNGILSFGKMRETLANDPQFAVTGFGAGFLIWTLGFSLGISLLIWFFISRKASNIAKWIFVVMFLMGLLMMPSTLSNAGKMSVLGVVPTVLSTLLQLTAAILLFRGDARKWFVNKGSSSPVDADIFE